MATKTKKKVIKWQYLGETDPAQYIHSNKTHRSASEAFRDAEYATAIIRPRSEWEDVKEFLAGSIIMFPLVAFAFYVLYLVLIAKGY